VCRRRARVAIAAYVLRTRFEERGRSYENSGPEERRYVANLIKKMLDAAGLSAEGSVTLESLRRSERGQAMRARQLTDGRPDASGNR
jgi:hypothetical protein